MSQSWVNCVAFTNELEEEVLLFYFNVISIYPEVYRLCSSFISFFLSFFFYFWFFRDRVSLYSPGCSGTHFVDQAGLELRNRPASASQVLGLKMWATTAQHITKS